MITDWKQVRREFPALERWTYLNTATYGQVPQRAVRAIDAYFARRVELACTDFMTWFDDMDRVRAKAAALVNASPADIAFVPNSSTALSLMMAGIDWKPGDRVVTLANEFPNHYYYPLTVPGVEFVEVEWERFYDAITPRTRLVAISSVNYATGFLAPVAEISRFLRERGVLFYVDGTQSLGALRFDVAEVRPSMLSTHGYKWLLSPSGAGFVYVAPEVREWLKPAVIGWRSHKDWRSTERLHHGAPEFKREAERYEGGGPDFTTLYAMEAVLDLLFELGLEAVERRVLELALYARKTLEAAGAEVLPGASQVVTARFPGRDVCEVARRLAAQRIIVSARKGNLRVSPHFYNREADLDLLGAALAD